MADEQLNPLEYRPSFQREERERTAWDIPADTAPPTLPQSAEPTTIGGGLLTETVKHLKELGERLDVLVAELYDRSKGNVLPFPAKMLPDIARAKQELGLTGDAFTFADYVHALEQWELPAGDFLTEVAERHIEGTNGNLDMELYQDYHELRGEYDLLLAYLQRTVSPFLAGGEMDWEDPDWEAKLHQHELEWGRRRQAALQEKAQRDTAYREAFLKNPSDLNRQRQLRYQEEEGQKKLESEHNRIHDTLLVIQNKMRGIAGFIQQGEALRQSDWTLPEQEAILYSLAGVTEDKSRNDRLTASALMLTLTVENRNSEKHHVKHALRNTYAPTKQRRVLDELSLYHSLYDRDVLPLLHTLRAYGEEPSAVVSSFLDSITLAMGDVAEGKEKRILDWQNIQMATSNLRNQKLREVEEKEMARRGYRLLRSLQEEATG